MSDMRFDDDVVIVTGAGRGLGRAYALLFAERGAAVVVNDVDATAAQAVAAEIESAGGRALGNAESVDQQSGATALLQAALTAFGRVTVLINNAGVISFAPLADITDTQWRQMMAVTLDGMFNMTRAVWSVFAAQGYGRVVNTTSNAGFAGCETLTHYGAAKLGVAGFTRALAHEAAPLGIHVNAVAPMAITRMNRDAFFGGQDGDSADWQGAIRSGAVPMGPPEAVAPTVVWLAHRSTNLNGEIFSSSSGRVARLGFVLGTGYFNPDHGPEDLRDHLHQVRSIEEFMEPAGTSDELGLIPPLFTP